MISRTVGRAIALPFACLAGVACLASIACIPSCSSPESLGRGFELDATAPSGSFTTADASASPGPKDELTQYCPSDKCPEGFTTCPGSTFPCDVDLRTDINNCGACGSTCKGPNGNETFECVEGRCALRCPAALGFMDCDGIIDNGCETPSDSPKSCGACGNVCADDKPCILIGETTLQCGCDPGMIQCEEGCTDPRTDDQNCGGCYNFCDPGGPGTDPPANMYFGCLDSQCDNPKCISGFADCDGDKSNGCEVDLTSNDSCGTCGNACPSGKNCLPNENGVYQCLCATGQTFCNGTCVDLATNANNCGSCGYQCNPSGGIGSIGVCTFGTCSLGCVTGRADCNGNPADGCETNTTSDPQNCGGCGITCDGIPGQACVHGQCAIAPCQTDGGPVTR